MRKFLLFSSVAVLSFAVFAQQPGLSLINPDSEIDPQPNISTSGGGITVQDPGMQMGLRELGNVIPEAVKKSTEETIKFITADLSKQTEALQVTSGIKLANDAAIASAQDTNAALLGQQVVKTNVRIKHQNQAAYGCVYGSVNQSVGTAEVTSRETFQQLIVERMGVLGSNAGTISENGRTDMNRRLFDAAMQFCNPAGMGGAAVTCQGSDDPNSIEHVSIGTLVGKSNVGVGTPTSADDLAQLEYLQNILYGQTPLALNPDLLENPTTEIKNLYVESDRLRAELGIGQAAFAQVVARRTPPNVSGEGSGVYLKELIGAGEFVDTKILEEILPAGIRPSLHAQYDAMTLGMLNPNFVMEKVNDNPELAPLAQVFNGILANRLMFDMLKELEFIKLAIASDISSSRTAELAELNARIEAANQR